MALFRLFLLLAVMGGLALLLVQNWSPALPLVFLGMRTRELPLALWLLFSVGAGVFTAVTISSLFQLASYFTPASSPRRPTRATTTSRSSSPPPRRPVAEPTYQAATPPPQPTTEPSRRSTGNDWDEGSNDDWDFDGEPKPKTAPPQDEDLKDSKNYDRTQTPKSGEKSGSVYSYSYREPKNSGVGKTESVYDADYRVITPPYNAEPPTNQTNSTNHSSDDDEDWGFLDEDEDFDDDDNRRRR